MNPKPNSLLWLWNRYQNSGFNGAPVISTEEMRLLSEKLEETWQFLRENNVAAFKVAVDLECVLSTIAARE